MKFETRVLIPEHWFSQSWEMFEASAILWSTLLERDPVVSERDNRRNIGAMKGALLLLGLAVENALKGVYVHKEKPDISRDKLSSKHFHEQPHDLIDIANRLNLSLTTEHKNLLERLTRCVQWQSKYRAPLKKVDLDRAEGDLTLSSTDFDKVEKMIEELQGQSGYDESTGWPDLS